MEAGADTGFMQQRSQAHPRAIRPMLVVLLAVLVVPLTLVFGLGLALSDEFMVEPAVRSIGVVALLIVPIIFAVQIRSRGGWTAIAGGLLLAGAMLVVVFPIAATAPRSVALAFASGATLGALILGHGLGHHRSAPNQQVPPRPDLDR